MAMIFSKTLNNAFDIRDVFLKFDRDYFPIEVYQAIFDFIKDTHADNEPYELDVIAWCCDLSETSLDDEEFDSFDALVEHLENNTFILFADKGSEIVYHLAY